MLHRYRSIVKDTWYRHFCALVTSTFQMMGCILYLGAEWHVGFIHLPTNVSPTLKPSLILHHGLQSCTTVMYTAEHLHELSLTIPSNFDLSTVFLILNLCRSQISNMKLIRRLIIKLLSDFHYIEMYGRSHWRTANLYTITQIQITTWM